MTRKLTNNDVVAIFRAAEQGVPNRELAKKYGVSECTISQIKTGTRHTGAGYMSKLTDAEVAVIQDALARGTKAAELARQYGVTPAVIRYIKSGARRPRTVAQRMVWLTLTEAEALLTHLDACQYWMTNHSLERENEELALMLQKRIDGEKK